MRPGSVPIDNNRRPAPVVVLDPQAGDDSAWDEFLATSPQGHLLQTSAWARLKAAFGWRGDRVVLKSGNQIVGGAQVLFRPLPIVSPLTIAYVPKGPVVDLEDPAATSALMTGLDRLCSARHALLLKVEPDWPDLPDTPAATLAGLGFQRSPHAIQPGSSLLIDLSAGLDETLARMSPKNRYNVRLSERKGVTVREGAIDDVALFHQLSQITAQRDGFAVHNKDYFETAYRQFRPLGQVRLLLAEYEGRLLAGLMAFALGRRAWYLYGASSNEERQRMPNYALQWNAMRWACGLGCETYDLWGIPDDALALEQGPEEVLKARIESPPPGTLWGVYRFKRGFGGQIVHYVGAYDRVYMPALYHLYRRLMGRRQAWSA